MAQPKENVDRPSTVNRSDRPKRVPINGYRNILAVLGKEPGWHYCWVPEHQLAKFESAHYEFVTHEVIVGDRKINAGSQIGNKVSMSVGNGVTGFLMRCTEEDHKIDRDYVESEADRQEDAMRSSTQESGRYGQVDIQRK